MMHLLSKQEDWVSDGILFPFERPPRKLDPGDLDSLKLARTQLLQPNAG